MKSAIGIFLVVCISQLPIIFAMFYNGEISKEFINSFVLLVLSYYVLIIGGLFWIGQRFVDYFFD